MQKMGDNYGNKFLAAALGLVALIALGLAWAFRLEPVGEQGLNFGYYRNRWTGTMYTRCGDTIETRAGREKRLERERAEEEARKAIERKREAARLELERIQKEKEDKAAEEEARKAAAQAREVERLGQERTKREVAEKADISKAQAAKRQVDFEISLELNRIDAYRLSLAKMLDEHPKQITFDIVGKQYPRKAIEEAIARLTKRTDELRSPNASVPTVERLWK